MATKQRSEQGLQICPATGDSILYKTTNLMVAVADGLSILVNELQNGGIVTEPLEHNEDYDYELKKGSNECLIQINNLYVKINRDDEGINVHVVDIPSSTQLGEIKANFYEWVKVLSVSRTKYFIILETKDRNGKKDWMKFESERLHGKKDEDLIGKVIRAGDEDEESIVFKEE